MHWTGQLRSCGELSLKNLVMRTEEMGKKVTTISTLDGLLEFHLFNRPHDLGKMWNLIKNGNLNHQKLFQLSLDGFMAKAKRELLLSLSSCCTGSLEVVNGEPGIALPGARLEPWEDLH